MAFLTIFRLTEFPYRTELVFLFIFFISLIQCALTHFVLLSDAKKMGIEINKVIDIEVTDEAIMKRMSGRRVCEKCGASYHIEYKRPAQDGVCDSCAGALVQRKDDHPDTVKARLEVYHKETEPLKDYYAGQGKLSVVEGQATVEDTTALILKAIEA